jgi:hypothetical protein
MIEEVGGLGPEWLERLLKGTGTRPQDTEKRSRASSDDMEPDVPVTVELRQMMERVKGAEGYRKERVHQILERLQRGELVTSETVREAAETILREGI